MSLLDRYRRAATLTRQLADAQAKTERAFEARSALPAGSSRAKVTTANARWMRAAEHRDRLLVQLEDIGVNLHGVRRAVAS